MASLPSPALWHQSDASSNNQKDGSRAARPEETRMCWICQEDESPNDPREWRMPCPCSATAHHECLLTWIARRPDPSSPIECPICKVQIQTNRSHVGLYVAVSELLEAIYKDVLVPATLAISLGGIVYSGFLVYGVNTVFTVFGEEEALKILAPSNTSFFWAPSPSSTIRAVTGRICSILAPFSSAHFHKLDWNFAIGLPLLAPIFVLSRTSRIDHALFVIPITDLVFKRMGMHPTAYPDHVRALALLPYMRVAYFRFYEAAFGALEMRWDAAIQHRTVDGAGAQDPDEGGRPHWNWNLDLDFQMAFNGQAPDAPLQNPPADADGAPDAPLQNPPADANGAPAPLRVDIVAHPEAADGEVEVVVHEPPPPTVHNRRRKLHLSTIVGGLLFPFLSSAVGDFLRLSLPQKYVAKAGSFLGFSAGRVGLLQQQWGRTIVGGCLLVVLRDAAVLTYKWNKANRMVNLQVLNFMGERRHPPSNAPVRPPPVERNPPANV